MSGSSFGNPRGSSGPDGFPAERTLSWGSDASQGMPYQERCVDPVEPRSNHSAPAPKAHPKDTNGVEPETEGFLPGTAEPRAGGGMCGPCALGSCSTFVCRVLTCGLYRVCRRIPCLTASESSPGDPSRLAPAPANPVGDDPEVYTDIHLGGVPVDISSIEGEKVIFTPPKYERDRPPFHHSGSIYLDDVSDEELCSSGDVDSLITQKLLEVFTQFEIDELAKCTSDSMFLKRSNEISQLICDVVREHKLEERDAECRLVREIIRLSTRKKKQRPPTRRLETPPDSGNDTMRDSSSKTDRNDNSLNLDIQISTETSCDIRARQMRFNSKAHSPSSPTPHSPSFQDTDTDSSGAPLLRKYVST